MQVKLKVVGGKHDGREIGISVPRFIIGRGEDAHLRPNSDLVSRKHCEIKIDNGCVLIKDLGSRNGTFVNDKKLEGEHTAKPGDVLRVGRLQFEILLDVVQAGMKKKKVQGVADAVARTASGADDDSFRDDSISDWLAEAPPQQNETRTVSETQQFHFDDTSTKLFLRSGESVARRSEDSSEQQDDEESKSGRFKKKKAKPGKLPQKPKQVADSTKGAADDVLRKFFNRR